MPSLVSTGSITIADVNDGSSVYTASIYIQQVSQPATPSGGSYNFSSKTLTSPSGWVSSLPAASTTPTWVSVYTFSTITPSIAVTATTWGVPTLFVQNGASGTNGTNGLTAILSNESHVFPASSSGAVLSYSNSGTDIRVYEGGTLLVYDGGGTANGTWKITSVSSNITVGSLTDQGAYLTVGAHSGVADATDLSSVTYTITGKNSAGTDFTLVKLQSFTKSKAGSDGSPGAQGPTIRMISDRPPTFSSTDGALDSSQVAITFSLILSGISASTYAWTFVKPDNTLVTLTGVTTNSATCTISQANFIDGDATRKSLKVVCVVNGVANYTDSITITRLEKSTAAAGATVGASWGSNISNQPSDSQIFNNMQHDSWIAGQTPPWSLNGASVCSAIVYDTNVHGVQAAVWKCTSDTSGAANGGWYSSAFNVDKTKPYRFAVTVKITSGSTGSWFWGVMENSVCDLNTTNKNGNPYFRYGGRSGLELNRWYLIVGYVFPAGSTGNTNDGSGIWDMTTGNFVAGGTNFCWASDTTYSYSRAFQYYCSNAGETQVFGYPVVEVVDGTESKLFNNLGYSALLNTQQKWIDVSGTGRPADNATVGANSSNLTIGTSVNLIKNADFYNASLSGWNVGANSLPSATFSYGCDLPGWFLTSGHTVWIHQADSTTSGYCDFYSEHIPVIAGKRYEYQCKTGSHRCTTDVFIFWFDSAGNVVGNAPLISNAAETSGGTQLDGYKLCGGFATAPTAAVQASLIIRKNATYSGNGDSWSFFTQAYFGEALTNQTEFSKWVPGGSAGAFTNLQQITSSNASTFIANAAIGSAQIGSIALTGTGNFSVNSLANGTGVIQDNRGIRIYSNGVRRVMLGDLSVPNGQ